MSIQNGARLADLRKRRGYSQEALAEKLGLSRQAISKWERGESSPDTDTLIALARLYGVSLDELIDHTPTETVQKEQPASEPVQKEQPARQPAAEPDREATPAPEEKSGKEKAKSKGQPLYPGLAGKLLKFPFPVVIIALYLLAGFTANLWHPMWLLFLLIPAYYHFALWPACATNRRSFLQGLPVIEAALILFLLLGFLAGAWSWSWIILILAALYHWYIGSLWKEKKE